jgi:predicted RNA-binding Zn-ribbon protein involved in translation (DUF1610 family)
MRERVYCPDCGIEMQFHPVTSDYTLTRADLLTEEDLLSGILDEFYSCPACGQTAVPTEEMYAQQAMNAYAWHQVVAVELF